MSRVEMWQYHLAFVATLALWHGVKRTFDSISRKTLNTYTQHGPGVKRGGCCTIALASIVLTDLVDGDCNFADGCVCSWARPVLLRFWLRDGGPFIEGWSMQFQKTYFPWLLKTL